MSAVIRDGVLEPTSSTSTAREERQGSWNEDIAHESYRVISLLQRNITVNRAEQSDNQLSQQGNDTPITTSVDFPQTFMRRALDLPRVPHDADHHRIFFEKLQEWEGYVVHIGEKEFVARLVDLTRSQRVAEEEVAFPLADLSHDDRQLLREGAIFRWSIGYQRLGPGRPKQRISQIVFRRVPAWMPRDLELAERVADELEDGLKWE